MDLGTGSWSIDLLVTGFPGKAVCHGGLGWSTIALMRGAGRTVLVDTGSFGTRTVLRKQLADRQVKPEDVTDILLTHSHYDHSVNYVLFPKARVAIGRVEIDWALTVPWGETPVPELYAIDLDRRDNVVRVDDGGEVLPGITAHVAPGHTPGCLVYLVEGPERNVVFTGDAAKNRAELVSGDTDMTYDAAASRASIGMILGLARRRPGTIIIPGHDLPLVERDGRLEFIGRREAAISAWFGDGMDETTRFELTI